MLGHQKFGARGSAAVNRLVVVPVVLTALLVFASVSCGMGGGPQGVVNHSFSRPDDVLVKHLDLDLEVDFAKEQIRGKASLHIENKTGASKLIVDTYALRIQRVTIGGEETQFKLGEAHAHLGQALTITIDSDTRVVDVHYETTPDGTAIDWLQPSQTAGGKSPFLFTQGQAILNRSWIPCQDTPAVRITYNARIKTQPGLIAVMSARNPTKANASGVYEFAMPQPIPPYLIALAIGDLEFRAISDRCGVYAEPPMVERAAWEFADTEKMIQTAEALYGPYAWERYDVIVLPPSFPFGGMENPRLSFVTPVLVAGDRSLVSTIAHELAHSWSGNLVTNETWNDFWLNEGFTTYFERRILEALYGADYMEMQAVLGFEELEAALTDQGADSPSTRLHTNIDDGNPDDGINTVPYEKGYLFLRLIEQTVGRDRWDAFLKGYFDRFAFQTMTSDRFVEYLRHELVGDDKHVADRLRIDEWVTGTGLPDNHPQIHSPAFDMIQGQVDTWMAGTPAKQLATGGWSTQEWKQFIQRLPDSMTHVQMADLDNAFQLTDGTNGELLQVWFLHAIANEYEPAYPRIDAYLTGIGRIWLIAPLYRKLAETPEGLKRAKGIYERARPLYHKLAVGAVDGILAK